MTVIDLVASTAAFAILALAAVTGYFVFSTRRIAAQAERAVPPVGKFLEVGGDRIHYMEAGQGRPIVFIHGLGGQLHHFVGTLFPRLSGDFHVVALDRPGSGYSRRGDDTTAGVGGQAAAIAAFIDAMHLERPLVVGHSLGGTIALALAIDHPHLISGLVLLSPLTNAPDAVPPEFRSLYVRSPLRRRIIAETVGVPTALRLAPKTLAFVFGPQKMPPDYPIAGGGMVGLRPAHYYGTTTDLVATGDTLPGYQKRYGEIGIPAGLLFGTADRVLDYRVDGLRLVERLPALEAELLEGMGHMLPFVATDQVERFVRRIAARAFA
jgi:pimeloyl-ACP methyl ester carboxylesterase